MTAAIERASPSVSVVVHSRLSLCMHSVGFHELVSLTTSQWSPTVIHAVVCSMPLVTDFIVGGLYAVLALLAALRLLQQPKSHQDPQEKDGDYLQTATGDRAIQLCPCSPRHLASCWPRRGGQQLARRLARQHDGLICPCN